MPSKSDDSKSDDPNPDNVLAACETCGEQVLEPYLDDGECPDCRE